ncbi:hypothetical protein ANAPC5_01497 [Anaplasma phagocytophilum]|nr:hypothetical protein ANAPC5_01497 [Anaplasma phagocytophilum]
MRPGTCKSFLKGTLKSFLENVLVLTFINSYFTKPPIYPRAREKHVDSFFSGTSLCGPMKAVQYAQIPNDFIITRFEESLIATQAHSANSRRCSRERQQPCSGNRETPLFHRRRSRCSQLAEKHSSPTNSLGRKFFPKRACRIFEHAFNEEIGYARL